MRNPRSILPVAVTLAMLAAAPALLADQAANEDRNEITVFGGISLLDASRSVVLDQFLSGKTEHDVHATAGLLVRF